MRIKFAKSDFGRALEATFKEASKPVTDAAVGALRDVAKVAVAEGRANILSAGKFTSRWAKALTYRVYANKGLDAAALIYHKFAIAGVFEEGATITGKPLLWIPIGNVRGRPKNFHGKLASVNLPGRRPMLVGEVSGKRIPLFVGIDRATIRKRFNIIAIVRNAAERLGEFYSQRFRQL